MMVICGTKETQSRPLTRSTVVRRDQGASELTRSRIARDVWIGKVTIVSRREPGLAGALRKPGAMITNIARSPEPGIEKYFPQLSSVQQACEQWSAGE
jgi:hypothetical protein